MPPKYAAKTTVTVEKSKMEIERLCLKYGATKFVTGWTGDSAMIMFVMNGRHVRFDLPIPHQSEFKYEEEWHQRCRQLYRILMLVLKAKFNVIEMEFSTVDAEFMANLVLPDNSTVAEVVIPMIEEAYETGKVTLALPDYS